MRGLKSWVRGFFGFSRAETNAFVILVPLMVVLIFSEPAYRYWFVKQPLDYSTEKKRLDSLLATLKWEHDSTIKEPQKLDRKLFVFDPNQSTKEELINVGFTQSLASRIINYRSKGGKFLIKRDLLKIYGVDSSLYNEVANYVNLPESISKKEPIKKVDKKENPVFVKFDLNLADTAQLIKVYGIGPKLSSRIVAYREKLGGFISRSQLNEVYGLDSAVVRELSAKSFISENFHPQQININTATEKEIGSHPYIKFRLAKAIVAYRMQHGAFSSIDDLKRIVILDENNLQRMRPYLSVGQ